MKKTMWVFLFMTMCSGFLFSSSIQKSNDIKGDIQDKIELSREGGTTRGASSTYSRGMEVPTATPIVEAFNAQEVLTLSIQNYRGGAWVEISGPREVKQSYVEVYDMGFDVVSLAGLRAGKYTIKITLGSEVFTGTFKIQSHGR